MQIAWKLDQVTKDKIKKSALIGIAGFVLAVVPELMPSIAQSLASHSVIATFIGSAVPFVLHALYQWIKGVDPNSTYIDPLTLTNNK